MDGSVNAPRAPTPLVYAKRLRLGIGKCRLSITRAISPSRKSPQKQRFSRAFPLDTDRLQKRGVAESRIAPYDHRTGENSAK
jgi:hypothetical protein